MKSKDWKFCQQYSDEILTDGIFEIQNQTQKKFSDIVSQDSGNYFISSKKNDLYIGEGKNLSKRLKQQFKPTISTFYKNYLKTNPVNKLDILDFNVRAIITKIGRKEIEEFGIVNLKTNLNKFQLDKRSKFTIKKNGLWQEIQNNYESIILEAEKSILNNKYSNWFDSDVKIISGLYIVKNKKDELIYIGESSNINERYKTHSGRTYFSALRRHIGTEILNFELQEIKGKKRYFTEKEDIEVTKYLKNCGAIFYPINFGRYEIEEFMIKKHKPLLNRKDNKD